MGLVSQISDIYTININLVKENKENVYSGIFNFSSKIFLHLNDICIAILTWLFDKLVLHQY